MFLLMGWWHICVLVKNETFFPYLKRNSDLVDSI